MFNGILLLLLVLISFYDLRYREIPIRLLAIGTGILFFFSGHNTKEQFIFGIFVFVIYVLLAVFFEGGGGDAILMSCLALLIGKQIILLMFYSHILFLLVALFARKKKQKETELPFAPFALIGYILVLI